MPADFKWIHACHGHVPEDAVEAGRTVDGEMLYVGRAYQNGIPCMGKVRREAMESFELLQIIVYLTRDTIDVFDADFFFEKTAPDTSVVSFETLHIQMDLHSSNTSREKELFVIHNKLFYHIIRVTHPYFIE